jgi:hypothetical protein
MSFQFLNRCIIDSQKAFPAQKPVKCIILSYGIRTTILIKLAILPIHQERVFAMSNVYVEPAPNGKYQIEFADGTPTKGPFDTQKEAIDIAKKMGHHPLVARVRHLNDKKIPGHWRPAE